MEESNKAQAKNNTDQDLSPQTEHTPKNNETESYETDHHIHPKKGELRNLIIRTSILFLVAITIYGLLFFFFRNELKEAGVWLSQKFSYWGVFFYVLIVDTLIVPATADVVYPLTMDWDPVLLLTAMSVASIIGGWAGYAIGRFLNRFKFVQKLTNSYREKGEDLIKRFGIWAVIIAGLTPVPFSTVSWIAGMMRMKFSQYVIGSLSRAPRFVLYYFGIKAGLLLVTQGA